MTTSMSTEQLYLRELATANGAGVVGIPLAERVPRRCGERWLVLDAERAEVFLLPSGDDLILAERDSVAIYPCPDLDANQRFSEVHLSSAPRSLRRLRASAVQELFAV